MEERTQKSLNVLIARVEAHKPKDMDGAKALAKEITDCRALIRSKLQKADMDFRLLQSKLLKEMHDHPDKEDAVYKKAAESKEHKDLLHYTELKEAFNEWTRNSLEKKKRAHMKKELENGNYKKKLSNKHQDDDDF